MYELYNCKSYSIFDFFFFFSQGLAISGALSYAVKQINKCSCLLPSVELDFVYKDTEGNEQISTESVVDLICK